MITCTKKYTDLPFAHRQWKHPGHCSQIHGHNFTFVFEFWSYSKDRVGFTVDFGKLKWLKKWIDERFDHTCVLCEDDPLLEEFKKMGDGKAFNITEVPDASCEGIAKYLFDNVSILLKHGNVLDKEDSHRNIKIRKIEVIEDGKNSATFTNPERLP